MSVYKLYAKEVRGQKDQVYLYLYKLNTGDKQPLLTSLKIRIPKRFCLPSVKEFRKVSSLLDKSPHLKKTGFDSSEALNNFLEERLENFQRNNGRKETLPFDKRTLNNWFTLLINRQLNQGTKLRYQNVLNLLIQFQKWYSKNVLDIETSDIILMKDINIDYILSFQKWLLSEPNENERRKRNTLNSSNYKLKCLKSILNKSHSEEYFTFYINPFDHITFSNEDSKIEILNIQDLKKLIETQFVEVYRRTALTKDGGSLFGKSMNEDVDERNKRNKRYKQKHTLNDIRNYFLFQLLGQGIRVSDLITLRWSNFEFDGEKMRINKRMVKTKKHISILVNEKMCGLISHYISRYESVFPKQVKEIIRLNDEVKSLYNFVHNDFTSILSGSDELYRHIEVLNDMNVYDTHFYHYRTLAGYIMGKDLIEKMEDYLLNYDGNLNVYLRIRPTFYKKSNSDLVNEFLTPLRVWLRSKRDESLSYETKRYENLKIKRQSSVINLINKLNSNKEVKNEFVFLLLNNKDFEDIVNEDFSRLSELQYRKFQSVRCYYNKLLKLVAVQSKIKKKLSTHIARHSYTSLMLELGENINLFDLMTSLGHQHLTTTQTYIQRLSNKKVDNLNEVISNSLDTGINLNL
jgi:integrase